MRLAQGAAERLAKAGEMGGVALVVGEAGEMHPAEPGEVPQLVERADLVPPVGRIRDPVGEEEELGHQASPRAITGPSTLARGSGSFCQSAIFSRYLGSSGLIARGSAPSAVRRAPTSGLSSKFQIRLRSWAPVPSFERPKSARAQPRSAAWRMKA